MPFEGFDDKNVLVVKTHKTPKLETIIAYAIVNVIRVRQGESLK